MGLNGVLDCTGPDRTLNRIGLDRTGSSKLVYLRGCSLFGWDKESKNSTGLGMRLCVCVCVYVCVCMCVCVCVYVCVCVCVCV